MSSNGSSRVDNESSNVFYSTMYYNASSSVLSNVFSMGPPSVLNDVLKGVLKDDLWGVL